MPLASQKNQAGHLLLNPQRRRRNHSGQLLLQRPPIRPIEKLLLQQLQIGLASLRIAELSRHGVQFGLGQRLGQLLAQRLRRPPPVPRPDSGVPTRRPRFGRQIAPRTRWFSTPVQSTPRSIPARPRGTLATRTTTPRPAATPARPRRGPSSAAAPTARPARPAHRAPPARWGTACPDRGPGSGRRWQRATCRRPASSDGPRAGAIARSSAGSAPAAASNSGVRSNSSTVLPVRCGGPPVNMQYNSAPSA